MENTEAERNMSKMTNVSSLLLLISTLFIGALLIVIRYRGSRWSKSSKTPEGKHLYLLTFAFFQKFVVLHIFTFDDTQLI